MQRRKAQNSILVLINENGLEQVSEGLKGKIAVEYFRNFFMSTKSGPRVDLLEGMAPMVTDDMNHFLKQPVTSKEIKTMAFGVKINMAPNADGMTG